MMEAVHRLRELGALVQFERELLTENDVDRSRPILDVRRRFDVALEPGAPIEAIAAALVAADPTYDAVALTARPPSQFVFPRSATQDRFGRSELTMPVTGTIPAGQTIADAMAALGLLPRIAVFDRAGFLQTARAGIDLHAGGRPAYQVLGELFASCRERLVWDLTRGPGPDSTVMAISRLP